MNGGAIVTFRLDGKEYGLDVQDVVEVTSARPVTPLPGTSDRVVGVTTWRGKTVPVLDPRRRLKRRAPAPELRSRLLVVGRPGPFALLIGEPGRVLPRGDLRPIERVGIDAERDGDGVSIVATPGGLVRVLDPARILGDPRCLVKECG